MVILRARTYMDIFSWIFDSTLYRQFIQYLLVVVGPLGYLDDRDRLE
jgi:hypothetical protein